MKIETKEATVTSNIPKSSTNRMAIDIDGVEHIMTLLTNLYKDPELAVIREYYTNAVDAHVAAGVKTHVKVTLPSWDSPSYIVQDFGIGMSEWDIKNIYSQYGASTKRDTNDQVGAFGLGCKSAFAIANHFTVVSVKNGMKCTTLFSKDVSGAYESTVVSNVETADQNGTLVKIPVQGNTYSFNSKARKFFEFSPPGSVLLDGGEPAYALDNTKRIDNPKDPDMIVHLRPKASGESYVIMGSVPYALSENEIMLSMKRLGVTASNGFIRMPKYFPVPIGSVDLTPSREGLRFTDKTNELIDSYMSFILNDLQEIAEQEMDDCTTLEEIFETYKRWDSIIDIKRKYKGEEVPRDLRLDADVRQIDKDSWGPASHSQGNWLSLDKTNAAFIVTGYEADHYKKVNTYLGPYMTAKNLDYATFIITDSKDIHTDKWVKMSTRFTVIKGDDIIEIGREQRTKDRKAASKANGGAAKSKIMYPVVFVDDEEIRWVAHDEIAEGTPFLKQSELWGSAGELIKRAYKYPSTRQLNDAVKYFEFATDATEIILLGNTRTVKALEQRVKGTASLLPEINKALEKVKDLLTDDVTRHYSASQSSWNRFLTNSGIDDLIAEVEDPDIVQVISPNPATVDAYKSFLVGKESSTYFANIGAPTQPTIVYTASAAKSLDEKYPLIDSINMWSLTETGVKHIVKYFNVIHRESVASLTV